MAQAARLNLRMQKELQLLLTDPPPRASFPLLSSNSEYSSLSTIDAEIEGPEGTVYANGIFKIRIQIPERYPFQPPSVTFATPVYHPNIDNGGRICLDILNLPPKGAWQPSLNISTVLTSIGLLLSEPNPDDGLMCDASREFKYNRQVFDQKARSMTEKYAKAGAIGNSCPSQAFQNSSNLGMIELRGSEECKLKASESISSHKKPCKITQEVPMETSSSSQVGDIGREMKKVHNEVQMEATGKRKQANVALDYSNMIDEMHATRRKLALGFSYKSQQKEGHCKENVMPNQNSASCLQLPVYSSESTNVTYPSKDVIERVGNCGIDVKSNKRCMVGKKLSLGPKCSSRGEETDNKENVAPIPKQPLSSLKSSFTESEIGQKLCLGPLTQLRGRGENNSHCPCEVKSIHTENKCNEMKKFNKDCGGKIVAESEQEKVEESLISEEAIVLDSEDSEDEKDGISRCRLSFVQKRMGKWRFKA